MAWERNVTSPSSTSTDPLKPPSPSITPLGAAAHLLNAERAIKTKPGAMSIAIPWPNDLPDEIANSYTEDHDDATKPRYIQVDIHHCDSLERFHWTLFRHAHGDIWNVLGSILRPFGLTADEVGFYIRIPEIEPLNRKQAKVLLTNNPSDTLDFLGLKQDQELWEEPFASAEDLFEYAATCRLFQIRPLPDEENDINAKNDDNPDHTTAEDGDIESSVSNSRSRRTKNLRPIYRKWVDEFIPACRQAGRFTTQTATRDSVRSEAFNRFPGAQHAYESRLSDWRKERQRQSLFRDVIKPSIPEGEPGKPQPPAEQHWRSTAASALKKIIMQDDYSLGIRPAAPLRDSNSGLYDEDKVRRFVDEHWEWVGCVAWKRSQGRYAEKLAVQKGARGADGEAADGKANEKADEKPDEK